MRAARVTASTIHGDITTGAGQGPAEQATANSRNQSTAAIAIRATVPFNGVI